ncbi:hypothetical protein [Candidatus Pelagibacter sp. HIMB1746]|uniref:hypothetical protein n=1 Tax=Candidatus Pelagibacter sp. HIMB1746 TaxID=3413370 RepID=UPI003F829928
MKKKICLILIVCFSFLINNMVTAEEKCKQKNKENKIITFVKKEICKTKKFQKEQWQSAYNKSQETIEVAKNTVTKTKLKGFFHLFPLGEEVKNDVQ